jgi:hypothetical protein
MSTTTEHALTPAGYYTDSASGTGIGDAISDAQMLRRDHPSARITVRTITRRVGTPRSNWIEQGHVLCTDIVRGGAPLLLLNRARSNGWGDETGTVSERSI